MRRLLLGLALASTLTTGCSRDEPADGGAVGPFPDAPIVLVSIDTLRSDRLPAYGYSKVATPHFDRLAADGVVFERAYSNYPLTLPSHSTLLTGLLPSEHGVRDNVGYQLDTAHHPYLPLRLAQRGYATGAAVSTWLLREDTGLGAGFDHYDDALDLKAGASLGESQRSGEITTARALDWLREQTGKYFLFLHLYEPHTPYAPPEPYRSRYQDPYDGEIAFSDDLLGRVLAALDERGEYDDALIVVLSDHGEGLGDHGEKEHGILLYRESLQVPLLVKLPRGRLAGTRVAAPAQLADVAPTLDRLSGGDPGDRVTLFDLLGPTPPQRPLYAETYYPRIHLGWSDLASLIEGDLHYIEGPDPELYDLAADPGQSRNVLRDRRREYAALRSAMPRFRTELTAPAAVDEESMKRLAALGYLSSSAAPSDGPLPDPKAKLPELNELNRGIWLSQQRRWDEAIETLTTVLAGNPRMADGWEALAMAYQQRGRFDEAEKAFGTAMELTGGADHVALGMARLYVDARQLDKAREHAELATRTSPGQAFQLLADIALEQDDFAAAERFARQALDAREEQIGALLALARVKLATEKPDEALAFVERAREAQAARGDEGRTPGLHFTRGEVLARLGRAGEAEAAFREEIRRSPQDPRAYTHLSLLLALQGRGQDAVATLREMVESNENPASYAAAVEALRVLGDPAAAGRLLSVARQRFPHDPRLRDLAS